MNELKIDYNILNLASKADSELKPYFDDAEEVCNYNCKKVLEAFVRNKVSRF